MAVKVTVRAKVINIRKYKPKAGERVFVDTTDDADYLTIAGATILTANQNSIDPAHSAGLLLHP
jgi:hypothetical protein